MHPRDFSSAGFFKSFCRDEMPLTEGRSSLELRQTGGKRLGLPALSMLDTHCVKLLSAVAGSE